MSDAPTVEGAIAVITATVVIGGATVIIFPLWLFLVAISTWIHRQ
jgi:hypothetical protein